MKWIRGEGWSYRFTLWLCDWSKCQLSVCLINAGDTNLVNDLLHASQGCQYLDAGELILINSQNHLLLPRGVLVLALNPKALTDQRTDRLRWFTMCTSSKEQFTKYKIFHILSAFTTIQYNRYFENILSECFSFFLNKSVAHLIFIWVFQRNKMWHIYVQQSVRVYSKSIVYVLCMYFVENYLNKNVMYEKIWKCMNIYCEYHNSTKMYKRLIFLGSVNCSIVASCGYIAVLLCFTPLVMYKRFISFTHSKRIAATSQAATL